MTTLALRPPPGPHAGSRGPAVGLGISLLVHAAVLAWLMHVPAPRLPATRPVARMTVWLAPPRPARPTAPETGASPAPAAAPSPAAPRHRARARTDAPAHARAAAILSVPPAPSRDGFAVPPDGAATPAPGKDAGPVVDLVAARAEARAIAREDGRNLVSLPERKPVVDPNAGRAPPVDPIEAARRHDCKTAYAGAGLLAVIPLVADAVTGTGCKW